MAKLNVLVTGANGFVGKAFLQRLDQQKYNIFTLDKKNDSNISHSQSVKYFPIDISIPFHLEETFDFCFHCAALNVTNVNKASYQDYHLVNVVGTQNVIKAVESKKFIFMSSAKVYQKMGKIITEDSSIKPENDYEKSKYAAEEICRHLLKTDQLIIVRPVNIVGPGQADKAMLPIFFKNAIKNQSLDILAHWQTILQLLDVNDVLRLFEMLLTQESVNGVFNLSSRDHITLKELVHNIVRMTDSRSKIKFSKAKKTPGGEIISKRAKDVLGWEAQVSIEEILNKYYTNLEASAQGASTA